MGEKPPGRVILEEALAKIEGQPKKRFTRQEIEEGRGELSLLNNDVFTGTFAGNKNNGIITGLVNALRKIHSLAPIPPLERTTVQNVSLIDVLERGMVGDLSGEGPLFNITVEVQKKKQEGYAVRGTITSSNVMRKQFPKGASFEEAPDVIGVNVLGFRLPELEHREMFVSRIVRAEYESRKPFLEGKYSDYYIELVKMAGFKKEDLPQEYHDLWDICCIILAKVKDHEEVIRMQAIKNPVALELSQEISKTVSSGRIVKKALSRKSEYEQLQEYLNMRDVKIEARGEARGEAKAVEAIARKALAAGIPLETIQGLTGLDIETIKGL